MTITITHREKESLPSLMCLTFSWHFPSKELDSLMALMEDNARRLGLIE